MCVLKTHMKCVLERRGTSRVFFTYFDVLFTPVINIAKHLSSLLYYSSDGLVFKQKFKAKVELIYGRLYNYRKNISKLITIKTTIRCWFPLCFSHELLLSLRML